jgi:glycine/D-amino acid oxidase-like deaminating enzyme
VREYPYWWDTVGQESGIERRRPVRPPAPDGKYDVVVVGAGYTGLAAARTLGHAGADVLVIEAERVGWGASSRNGGQVLAGLKLDPAELVARYGSRSARELFEASIAAIERLEQIIAAEAMACGYIRSGHIQCASKAAHFKSFRAEQQLLAKAFNYRVELVGRSDQQSEVGTDCYHGLLVDERSGAINPCQYVNALAASAERAGAVIQESTPVTSIGREAGGFTVRIPGGEIHTGDVLIATDAYSTSAAPSLQRRLVAFGSYIIATAPLDQELARRLLPRRRMAFDSKYFLHYFRLTDDHRLLFGGRAEFSRATSNTIRHAASVLRRDMHELFPELSTTRIEYAWGGNVAFARDQMPRAGRLDGQYYAGGYGGHGVAMATYLGELIGRRMGGEPIEHPLFDDAFPAIPMYRGKPWFLPVVGAYYRVKDWLG